MRHYSSSSSCSTVMVCLLAAYSCQAWTAQRSPVSTLLQQHAAQIAALKSLTTETIGSIDQAPYDNDVFYLRFCMEYEGDDDSNDNNNIELVQNALKVALDWRQSTKGQAICQAAQQAVEQAQADGEKWNNEVVLEKAPHSAAVSKYLTPDHCITTCTTQGDLIYSIRAGAIDDVALMSTVSIDELAEFFVYAKEVNFLVSLQRSLASDKLVSVLTANDLSGVKLIGGSVDFRQALSQSSKESAPLYPSTNGPTLLLNLPRLVSALVKLFTPLFPDSVRQRLRFEQGPLKQVQSLREIAQPGPARDLFLQQLDALVYNK